MECIIRDIIVYIVYSIFWKTWFMSFLHYIMFLLKILYFDLETNNIYVTVPYVKSSQLRWVSYTNWIQYMSMNRKWDNPTSYKVSTNGISLFCHSINIIKTILLLLYLFVIFVNIIIIFAYQITYFCTCYIVSS